MIRASRPAVGGDAAFPNPGAKPILQATLVEFVAPLPTPPPAPPVPVATPAVAPASLATASQPQPARTWSTVVRSGTGAPGGVWACIRNRESGGNYATNTGNGYYGAYQFSEATWRSIGGTGYPNQAPPAVQDAMARRLQARSGWGQWSTASMCGV